MFNSFYGKGRITSHLARFNLSLAPFRRYEDMTKSQIIKVVLDQMYELYQIDTSEVWPDDRLNEFGLDEQSIKKVFRSSLLKLGCLEGASGIDEGVVPRTAREIVERVHEHVSHLKYLRRSGAA